MLRRKKGTSMTDKSPQHRELEPLGQADHACVSEIRDVLNKHGLLDRFGLTLLHDHFDIAPDEILVETCDHESRTLTLKPMTAGQRQELHLAESSWRLVDGAALTACYQACVWSNGSHSWRHVVR